MAPSSDSIGNLATVSFLVVAGFVALSIGLMFLTLLILRIQAWRAKRLADFAAEYGYWPEGDPERRRYSNGVRVIWPDRVSGTPYQRQRLFRKDEHVFLVEYGPLRWNSLSIRVESDHLVFSSLEAALRHGSPGRLGETATSIYPPGHHMVLGQDASRAS